MLFYSKVEQQIISDTTHTIIFGATIGEEKKVSAGHADDDHGDGDHGDGGHDGHAYLGDDGHAVLGDGDR